MHGEKHRLRFEKSGDLRLLSHLDLMRSVERLTRRAQLPLKFTEGFHPVPRIVYALSLPLGVAGLNEVMEIELTESLEANVLMERMAAQAPNGLQFKNAYAIESKTSGVVRRAIYKLALTENDFVIASEAVPALMAQEKVWAGRRKPKPRQINIRPYIRNLIVERDSLTLDFWVTPYGTARADETIALLNLPSPFDTGAAIERTDLELHDETYSGLPDAPPSGLPELKPLDLSQGPLPGEPTFSAHWGQTWEGPVIE
jgi:radical SAM-linked protein